MAKKKGNDGWWIAGLVVTGLGLLYLLQTGLGKDMDAALVPETIEGKIDAVVAALNDRFGNRWVNVGLSVLKYYLHATLPASLVALVDIVATVENLSKRSWMSGYDKQRLAIQMTGAR